MFDVGSRWCNLEKSSIFAFSLIKVFKCPQVYAWRPASTVDVACDASASLDASVWIGQYGGTQNGEPSSVYPRVVVVPGGTLKVAREVVLINAADYRDDPNCIEALREIRAAIVEMVWPPNTDKFTIAPVSHGNGVGPIKAPFISALMDRGWRSEMPFPVETGLLGQKFGPMDAGKVFGDDPPFLVEWETGNISSSHRALNKMGVGLVHGKVAGTVLIVPTDKIYPFLTDRVGNVRELTPYFPVWQALSVERGFMAIFAFEHDEESFDVPTITKGTDGRALR